MENDHTFNIPFKRIIIYKSPFFSDFVEKFTLKSRLQYLIEEPVYKRYNIIINRSVNNQSMRNTAVSGTSDFFV